jgi:hypothetical protein
MGDGWAMDGRWMGDGWVRAHRNGFGFDTAGRCVVGAMPPWVGTRAQAWRAGDSGGGGGGGGG